MNRIILVSFLYILLSIAPRSIYAGGISVPTNFRVTEIKCNTSGKSPNASVSFAWDGQESATYYRIYTQTSDGVSLMSDDIYGTNYTHIYADEQDYSISINAINSTSGGYAQSNKSPEIIVKIPNCKESYVAPAPTVELALDNIKNDGDKDQITLYWGKLDVAKYNLYYSQNPKLGWSVPIAGLGNGYTEGKAVRYTAVVNHSSDHHFKVAACYSAENCIDSNIISVIGTTKNQNDTPYTEPTPTNITLDPAIKPTLVPTIKPTFVPTSKPITKSTSKPLETQPSIQPTPVTEIEWIDQETTKSQQNEVAIETRISNLISRIISFYPLLETLKTYKLF